MYTAGVLALISSVTAGKIITIFGFETSIATPIYAGIFLSTDILSEWYSKSDAKKTIYLGF
ncbi:MAG: VUT family protein, partial [Balneola sp.]